MEIKFSEDVECGKALGVNIRGHKKYMTYLFDKADIPDNVYSKLIDMLYFMCEDGPYASLGKAPDYNDEPQIDPVAERLDAIESKLNILVAMSDVWS